MKILPQAPVAPDGITVADLVGRGRYPHQGSFRKWTAADRLAVDAALEATGTLDLAGRLVDELSGGQRQRVWIAMTLAQGTGRDARDGAIVAEGSPDDIITSDLVTYVFGVPCRVIADPVSHTPMVVPIGRHLHVATETENQP